jgi:hypothetical protein
MLQKTAEKELVTTRRNKEPAFLSRESECSDKASS